MPGGVDDQVVSRKAAGFGGEVPALSAYTLEPQGRAGLLLGYAAVDQAEIWQAVRRLGAALRG